MYETGSRSYGQQTPYRTQAPSRGGGDVDLDDPIRPLVSDDIIRIVGDTRGTYVIEVSGTIEPASAPDNPLPDRSASCSANAEDHDLGSIAMGAVNQGCDAFRFTGDVVGLAIGRLDGRPRIWIGDREVDPDSYPNPDINYQDLCPEGYEFNHDDNRCVSTGGNGNGGLLPPFPEIAIGEWWPLAAGAVAGAGAGVIILTTVQEQ